MTLDLSAPALEARGYRWLTNVPQGEQHKLMKPGDICGDPKATDECTADQLKRLGLVGVYAND